MQTLSTDTEQLIKDTAKRVFFAEGKLHATTQDIADAAGINRASIHYYYRSRKQLLDRVLAEATQEMQAKLRSFFALGLSFRDMTAKFVEFFIEKSLEHPYLELFLVTESNTNPSLQPSLLSKEEHSIRIVGLRKGIAQEVAAGAMQPMEPEQFIITMMSLCSFPFIAKSLIKNILDLGEEEYRVLVLERKKIVMNLIFPPGNSGKPAT